MADVISNVNGVLRDAFEAFDPPTIGRWRQFLAVGANDIVQVDGNSAGASYLVVSKDPLVAGAETYIESLVNTLLPVEVTFGASLSQRTFGQEFSVELVDTMSLLPDSSDLAISSISQSASVLTVDTVNPHGLSVGRAIGIYGCSNQLVNFPAVVVATVPSPTQFTVTSSTLGALVSQTVTNPAGAKGFVFTRYRLGRAQNGVATLFENTTATNAAYYIRSEAGDALPSGVIAGVHSVTSGSTAPVQLVNSAFQYAFTPTTEYRMTVMSDKVQWSDVAIDATTQSTNRLFRTQVCPDPAPTYKIRIRSTNAKSLTVPNAQVVSVTKSGTTTATFTTDVAHNYTTGDSIVYYGSSDQAAANFPNLLTATAITVTGANTFTAVIGSGTTGTAYGGFVAKVQGGNLMSALGANAVTAISASLATLADNTRTLTVTGNTNWAGLSIGDYVNVLGMRNVVNGATLGVDGVYKVGSVGSAVLTLVPATAAQAAALPANFGTTNCGGGIIKRTDFRISYLRMFHFERERVEALPRPASDASAALPVVINNTPPVTISSGTVTTVTTVTGVTTVSAVTSANLGLPSLIADVASAAITTTTTTAAFTPTFGTSYVVSIPVTAVTGTTPTLDVSIEESDDTGTNWFKVYDFPRITANGVYRSPSIPMVGNRVRYVQTVGGGTPSFTRAINRLQTNLLSDPVRQLIDRTISLTTLNSVTPSLDTRDCGNRVQLVVNIGAVTTTAPALQLEGSDDGGASWYSIGSPLTAVASSTVQLTVVDINSALIRARVSTAGVGVTAGYVMVKGHD